jgi:hypothetical protein
VSSMDGRGISELSRTIPSAPTGLWAEFARELHQRFLKLLHDCELALPLLSPTRHPYSPI